MRPTDRPIYSIGAVATILHMPAATLRAWENRYHLVVPHRGHGTQRLYTRDQVEQLAYVKRQIEAGMRAADAHRLLEDELAARRPAGGGSEAGEAQEPGADDALGGTDSDLWPPLDLTRARLWAAQVRTAAQWEARLASEILSDVSTRRSARSGEGGLSGSEPRSR